MSRTAKELLSDMKAQNYIPEKIFVSKQSRGDDTLVGYMIPYIPNDSSYKAKEESCAQWGATHIPTSIFTNEFSEGYAIIKQVRRSESDAVYWRVLHPEGFEFEISLDNFEYIMNDHVIDRGIVVSSENTRPAKFKLIQKRSNRKWILVDDQHPHYLKTKDNPIPGDAAYVEIEQRIKDEAKAVSADLQIGDLVELGGYSYGQYIFMGTVTLGYRQHNSDELEYVRKRIFKDAVAHQYDNTITYEVHSASKKVTKIVEAAQTPLLIDDAVDEIRTAIKTHYVNGQRVKFDAYSRVPIGVWATKPKKKDVTIHQYEITHDQILTVESKHITPNIGLPNGVVFAGEYTNICIETDGKKYYSVSRRDTFFHYNERPTMYALIGNKSIPVFVYNNYKKELDWERRTLDNAKLAMTTNTDDGRIEMLQRALMRAQDLYDSRLAKLTQNEPNGWTIHSDITKVWFEFAE